MGLGITLSNALAGMDVSQKGLEVLSRNVSNAGTAGYHRQSLDVSSLSQGVSDSARADGVNRVFSETLQRYYTSTSGDFGYADTMASFMDRLQTYMGTPGSPGSLDTVYSGFQSSLQDLATSPDDQTVRASVVTAAQVLSNTFNGLSGDIQGLRQETENQIGSVVTTLNQNFTDLSKVNSALSASLTPDASRAALLDQRDRLVSQISQVVDVKATYTTSGAVNLTTGSGVGLLSQAGAPRIDFNPASAVTAKSLFSNGSDSAVGSLVLTTSSGNRIDMVKQKVLQGGQLGALVALRDNTLVQAQAQLDEIASSLATSMSGIDTAGTAITAGGGNGYEVDISGMKPGNSVTLSYNDAVGTSHTLKLVSVEDASKLPMDYTDASGARVVGVSFASGAPTVATQLQGLLPSGLAALPSGNKLQVIAGSSSGMSVTGLTTHTTATSAQGGGSALPLFVDIGNTAFTDSLDGSTQKLGFAGRISVNSAIVNNDKLLVQTDGSVSLGDATRPNYLVDRLSSFFRQTDRTGSPQLGRFQLSGNLQTMVGQVLNYQATASSNASAAQKSQQTALDAVTQRLDSNYGVNVDEEMSRLMELQNAYSAGARVITVVQELMNKLMQV